MTSQKCSRCRKSFSENFDILYAYIIFSFSFVFIISFSLCFKKRFFPPPNWAGPALARPRPSSAHRHRPRRRAGVRAAPAAALPLPHASQGHPSSLNTGPPRPPLSSLSSLPLHLDATAAPPQQLPPVPWQAVQNPWTGVTHAYSMPIPRVPVPGFFGARPTSHQALYGAPRSYPPAPLYGPSAAYGLPSAGGFAAPPPQPLSSAPALLPVPWDPRC